MGDGADALIDTFWETCEFCGTTHDFPYQVEMCEEILKDLFRYPARTERKND